MPRLALVLGFAWIAFPTVVSPRAAADPPEAWLEYRKLAMELHAENQERAGQERRIVEKEMAKRKFRIDQMKWALGKYESGATLLKDDHLDQQRRHRLMRVRQVWKDKYLHVPEECRGEIRSGRALNFVLDACGAMALDHQLFLESVGRADQLWGGIGEGGVLPQSARTENDRILDRTGATDRRIALVKEISGHPRFTREDLKKVTILMGLTGDKLNSRMDEVLPLKGLDELLALGHAEYRPHIAAIRTAKNEGLELLKHGNPATGEIQSRLTSHADMLLALVEKNKRDYFAELQARSQTPTRRAAPTSEQMRKGNQYVRCLDLLKGLRGGIARFNAAVTISDVRPKSFPPDDRQRVSAMQVLAFMCRNGYRFGEATSPAEATYQALFLEMTNYYRDAMFALEMPLESELQSQQMDAQRTAEFYRREIRDFSDPVGNVVGAVIFGSEVYDRLKKDAEEK
jgi:hypothetical protein